MTTDKEITELVPKIARNELFYFFARACMIAASLIGLPAASYMLTRVIAKADEISAQVLMQGMDLRLLSSRVEIQMKQDSENIRDHEFRLRSIERK